MDVCGWDWGAIATFTGAGIALYISWQWKSQKGSEILSTISKECHSNLNSLKDLAKQTVDSTSYQFSCWIYAEDPTKHYNNKYQYLFDDLNNKMKEIRDSLEVIKTYKKDNNFDQIVNEFNWMYESIEKEIKEMTIVIGTVNMANKYKQLDVDEKIKVAKDSIREFNNYIDTVLKYKLVKYVFFQE